MALKAVVEAMIIRERRTMIVTTRKRARRGIFRFGETCKRYGSDESFPRSAIDRRERPT